MHNTQHSDAKLSLKEPVGIPDSGNIPYYTTMEVSYILGLDDSRIRQIARKHGIGEVKGNVRLFKEEEIGRVASHTRKRYVEHLGAEGV